MRQAAKRSRWRGFGLGLAVALWSVPAGAHELWIEAPTRAPAGKELVVHVCFGHTGAKTSGEALHKYHSRLSAWVVVPDGSRRELGLAAKSDCFEGKLTADQAGFYQIGAELHAGILTKEFHGIPAHTAIVMYARSFTHVAGSAQGMEARAGTEVDLVPCADPTATRPGSLLMLKVLFQGKPLGGKSATLSVNTLGTFAFPDDPRVRGVEWTAENAADPRNGEVVFPLIVPGRHMIRLRYTDERAGRYEGSRSFATEFSRLEKGAPYERTLYVCTWTFDVGTP